MTNHKKLASPNQNCLYLFFAERVVCKNAVTKRGLVLELFAPSSGLAKPISSFSVFSCNVTAAWLVPPNKGTEAMSPQPILRQLSSIIIQTFYFVSVVK